MTLYFITQFVDQVKTRFISQLIKDISRVLQKLLRHFNGTVISTSFMLLLSVCPLIFSLSLNESIEALLASHQHSSLFKTGLSIQYPHKTPDVFE